MHPVFKNSTSTQQHSNQLQILPYEQHGRVCMLAALGLSVAPAFHFNDPVFDTTLGYGK